MFVCFKFECRCLFCIGIFLERILTYLVGEFFEERFFFIYLLNISKARIGEFDHFGEQLSL